MNWVKDLFTYLSDFLKWWVIVLPWQEGIRIRLGNHETHLKKGIYLKIPFMHDVRVQDVRLRYDQIPIMTIGTKDKHVVTITR
jgi:regulator of protease activity HflC (stomatin/prohibitin superfamily)